jgi:hypothetical protein
LYASAKVIADAITCAAEYIGHCSQAFALYDLVHFTSPLTSASISSMSAFSAGKAFSLGTWAIIDCPSGLGSSLLIDT